jgi:hypothetical protein
LCQKLPKTIRPECNTFVILYGPLVIKALASDVDPDVVCRDIKLCKASQSIESLLMTMLEPSNKIENTVSHDIKCVGCQFIMNILDYKLSAEWAEKSVEFSVDNACKVIPRRFKQQCQSLMSVYGTKLVEFMKISTDPFKACLSVAICRPEDKKQNHLNQEDVDVEMVELVPATKLDNNLKKDEVQCSLCMYAATIVKNALAENKTDEQIVTEMKLICNLFPPTYKEQV